jgi:anti-sigma factor ChrR (cupin superfamily)
MEEQVMKNLINLFDDAGWEKARDYPEGTLLKILRDNEYGKTILLKLPEGFKMPNHSHVVAEQHLVLRGSYITSGKTFAEGSFQIYDPHEEHGPFESENGALVLVIWDAIG